MVCDRKAYVCVCVRTVCVSFHVSFGGVISFRISYFLFIPRSPVSTHLQNPSYFMSTRNTAHRAGHDRSVFHTYVTIRKSDEDHHQKKAGRVDGRTAESSSAFPSCEAQLVPPSPWRAPAWFDAPPSTCSFSFDAGRAALTHSNWSTLRVSGCHVRARTPQSGAPGA